MKYHAPVARSTMILLRASSSSAVLAFGRGVSETDLFNDVWLYNTTSKLWKELHPSGDVPVARQASCGVVVDGTLYVYGGRTSDQRILNELWILNIVKKTWVQVQRLATQTWPPPTWKCSAATTQDGFALLF
eukprot:PhF_6_TR25490/c0_g1_i1/m.35451